MLKFTRAAPAKIT